MVNTGCLIRFVTQSHLFAISGLLGMEAGKHLYQWKFMLPV